MPSFSSVEMKSGSRATALEALLEVGQCRTPFKKAIDAHDPGLDPRDRALCLELVAGVLRLRGRLDYILSGYLKRPLTSSPPVVQEALRLGVFQLLFTDKIPPHAAINETVNLAKAHLDARYSGFVNGVLRNVSRNRKDHQAVVAREVPPKSLPLFLSHPRWLVERWVERFGLEETIRLCETNNYVPDIVLRVRTHLISVQNFLNALSEAEVTARMSPLLPDAVYLSRDSSLQDIPSTLWTSFQVQDTAAQMIAPLLEPRPHERILDACAAPGGKTTHLADLVEDRAEIIALDRDSGRMALLGQSLERLGLKRVKLRTGDFLEDPNTGLFDKILLDAPCSGLGVLRRNPDIKWCRHPADLERNRAIQVRMLSRAEALLRPGGTVVYAVCSVEPEETVHVLNEVQHQSSLRLRDVSRTEGDYPYFYCFPQREGTDGFFAAALVKC